VTRAFVGGASRRGGATGRALGGSGEGSEERMTEPGFDAAAEGIDLDGPCVAQRDGRPVGVHVIEPAEAPLRRTDCERAGRGGTMLGARG
jgi:hypothetical protein